MSIEAMKQALEALEGMYIEGFTQDNSPINNAITAIREALAEQPAQQEPVAVGSARCPRCWEPITPQPSKPWVGLTLGEAVEIWTKTKQLDTVIKLVEAKLKEKNA